MHLYCNFKVQERNRNIKSQNWSLHLLSQAAGENARPTCISVAAASVWTPAWRVTASPTVPTDQMRAQDVLNATAPAPQLLSVTTTVSAPQMARSVLNRCAHGLFFLLHCPKLNLCIAFEEWQASINSVSSIFHLSVTTRQLYINILTLFECAPSSSLFGLKIPFFLIFAEVLLCCRFQTALQCCVLCGHWRVQRNATCRMQTHLPEHPGVLHLSLLSRLLPGTWQEKLQDQRYRQYPLALYMSCECKLTVSS